MTVWLVGIIGQTMISVVFSESSTVCTAKKMVPLQELHLTLANAVAPKSSACSIATTKLETHRSQTMIYLSSYPSQAMSKEQNLLGDSSDMFHFTVQLPERTRDSNGNCKLVCMFMRNTAALTSRWEGACSVLSAGSLGQCIPASMNE